MSRSLSVFITLALIAGMLNGVVLALGSAMERQWGFALGGVGTVALGVWGLVELRRARRLDR